MIFIGLSQVAASVYQMMRGIMVVIIATMGIIFLKKKQYNHHWLAIGLIMFGVFLVGLSTYTASSSIEVGNPTLGLILLVTG
jgi:drug/metabolite transporter (DMT)-like permease